ncbi:MAG: hemerythrin domain-containing protein [Betaproteobacteria bacterium]|jgi:hemerythrin-like domain-containing protein
MADPISAWHSEHQYFLRLLGLLHKEVDAFRADTQPNYDLMLDIVAYLRDYTDQVHHPREDVAFARLAKHRPDLALTLARLTQEHHVIAHAGETLRQLLQAIVGGAIVPRSEVEAAAATYLVYYGNHIAKEEEDLISRAAQALTKQDWEAVGRAVPDAADPLVPGGLQDRYRELRKRIALEG